ncbi:MAG: TIGR01212 family radical SAM protein [Halobacteriovoraceae bacterium]|jgi:uncharacterized protein|nr:TIGR01212 family radical SAM protein [Halobacteriovoraceae bacterium]
MDINEVNFYGKYIKKRYGGRIQKITIDANFTCPNRDGSKGVGGCTYCNNKSFGTATRLNDLKIKDQLQSGFDYSVGRYKNVVGYFAYFQSYSNTYAPLSELKKIYNEALEVDKITGLVVGTRPDCIDREKLAYFENLTKDYEVVIEYGIESIYDETLERINRGHDYQCFVDAIDMTKGRGIKICAHIIIGFPWETKEQWIETAKAMSKLSIDYLKIHQLHVVKNTLMANEYMVKPFKLLNKEEYIDVLIEFLEHLRPSIVIQRLFGSASKELTVSPFWPETTFDLNNELIRKMKERDTYQGRLYPKNNLN